MFLATFYIKSAASYIIRFGFLLEFTKKLLLFIQMKLIRLVPENGIKEHIYA